MDRVFFLVSYGALGILPFAQLKIAWSILPPESIGVLFFTTSFSLLIAALCDANVNFRSIDVMDKSNFYHEIREAFCLRLTRFSLLLPITSVIFLLSKFDLYVLISMLLIVLSKLLNVSYIYRNSGSVTLSLIWELQSRFLILMIPILTVWSFGIEIGLVLGSFIVLSLQIALILYFFGNMIWPRKFGLHRSLDINLTSAFLGVGYANFCQVAAGFLLPSHTYAIFASFDKLVRACLLIVEPVRLLVLRESGKREEVSILKLISIGLLLALICYIATFLLFYSNFYRIVVDKVLEETLFIFVSATTSFVSFITVCVFIKHGFVRLMCSGLAVGLIMGMILFTVTMRQDIYMAVVLFESVVSLALLTSLIFIFKSDSKKVLSK